MTEPFEEEQPSGCGNACQAASNIEALNRDCYCLSLDEAALRRDLEADMGSRGLSSALVETHPHLFAALPVYVSIHQVERMARVIEAVEKVVATPVFRSTVLAWAPAIASFDAGVRGGLLGYDFHLAGAGPQLIEINTNPGGAMLNAVLGGVQQACSGAMSLTMAPLEAATLEESLFQVFMAEWQLQRGDVALQSVVIVDDEPERQYLYPEFMLFEQLLKRHGIQAAICDPRELMRNAGRLWYRGNPIDFVYNRLTDFALEESPQAALKAAYLACEVVVSPDPRAHALYADKRNLTQLSDEKFLRSTGVADDVIATLLGGIPRTDNVTPENRAALWSQRRQLFFKPAAGYGSKATYRGDKLTKRVWDDIAAGVYVAQALVAPSERHIAGAGMPTVLKVDVRNYAYAGAVKLLAARLYQGQTTNFRTPGGGFAPVFTERPIP